MVKSNRMSVSFNPVIGHIFLVLCWWFSPRLRLFHANWSCKQRARESDKAKQDKKKQAKRTCRVRQRELTGASKDHNLCIFVVLSTKETTNKDEIWFTHEEKIIKHTNTNPNKCLLFVGFDHFGMCTDNDRTNTHMHTYKYIPVACSTA